MRLARAVMMVVALETSPAFPDGADGWKAVEPPTSWSAESIFQYIDGHGEVYLAYGMRSCRAQRYAGPAGEADILADVFEMASPADAFGVFGHSRDGEAVPIGQAASLAAGTLMFFRDRHFVSIYAERETPRSRDAVLSLGHAIDKAIGGQGDPPPLVGRLPRDGLDERTIVWLRHPRILDAHARLGQGNPLAVGPQVPAVWARYARGAAAAELVLVDYPDEGTAATAVAAFTQRLLTREGGTTRHEDGWYAVGRLPSGCIRVFVLRAASRSLAEALVAATLKGDRP